MLSALNSLSFFTGALKVSKFPADAERSTALALSSFCVSQPISAQLRLPAADWFRRRKMRRRSALTVRRCFNVISAR